MTVRAETARGKPAPDPGPRPVVRYVEGWADNIPAELRDRPQWVGWRYGLDQNGKWTKLPRLTNRQGNASTTDPATWAPSPTALKAFTKTRSLRLDGIGFVFSSDDPYCGIDLDHCLDEQGNVLEWARGYVERLRTYAEVSPSGRGLKFIARGKLPGPGNKVNVGPDGAAAEMYGHARYFTVTGNRLATHPAAVEDLTQVVEQLHRELWPPKEEKPKGEPQPPPGPPRADDEAILAKAMDAANGALFSALWQGDTSRHGHDESRADLALCGLLAFWWGGDAAAVDRMFCRSGLMRDKWNERRGATTYGQRTIATALDGKSDFYDPGRTTKGFRVPGNGDGNGEPPENGNGAPHGGGFVGFVGTPPQESPKFEGPLKPLKGELPEVHPLPQRLIPAPLRGWLLDIARRGCFPVEYAAAAVVVALSILLGRNLCIRPKRHDAWIVVPNLWGAIVGPPGLQKTPAVEEALLPLRRLVADALKAHAEAERRALEDAAVAEAKAAAAKKKLAEAAKKGAPDDVLRQLAVEANAADAPAVPTAKRYVVNDATVEKLGELLRENPRGLFQFRDELTGWLRTFDRQGHESDRGFYLETWTGNGSYTFDRIGRGTIHVEALCLAVFGTIQPGPLAKYLKGAASGDDADGFTPRFQVLVYPDPPARFVNVDQWPDKQAKARAYEAFQRLDSIDPAAMGAELDEERGLYFLRFDDEAQALFDQWREELENRLRGGAETPLMAGHLSKYRSLMPALALQFHAVASVHKPRLGPVTKEAAEMAAAWCEVLESHARRAYQSAIDGDPETAVRLGERLKQSLPNPFTYRQVANKGWAGLDTVEDVRRTVGILEDRNWTRVVTKPSGPSGGRPSEEVWTNPAILNGEGGGS